MKKIDTKDYRLVKPNAKYRKWFDKFHKDYLSSGEKMVPFVLKFYRWNMKEYIKKLENFSKGIDIWEFVPHSTFWLKDTKNNIKWVVNIRHNLTNRLRKYGTHIGYWVAPIYRKKGYATIMLKLALKKAKEIGINKVLITCETWNIASSKVIINNDWKLDAEYEFEWKKLQRYYINN